MDLSPEDREALLRQLSESRKQVRSVFAWIFLVGFLFFAGLMLVMMRSVHDSQVRAILGLGIIAMGIFLLRAYFRSGWSSRIGGGVLSDSIALALRTRGKTTIKIVTSPTVQRSDLNTTGNPEVRLSFSQT